MMRSKQIVRLIFFLDTCKAIEGATVGCTWCCMLEGRHLNAMHLQEQHDEDGEPVCPEFNE